MANVIPLPKRDKSERPDEYSDVAIVLLQHWLIVVIINYELLIKITLQPLSS